MNVTSLALPDEYLYAIRHLKLIDDDFMDVVFCDRQCLELLLEIVLECPVDIVEYRNQHAIKNLFGRDIRIDALIKLQDNCYVNVEVQRKNEGAHPKRARYHQSLIDASISFSQQKWKEIPEVCVIFITEKDIFKKGLPVYHVKRRIEETGEEFGDETKMIYVNGSIQDDTPIGRLMHDFMCEDYRDMHYEILRKRVRYFKESEGGKKEMCEIFDEIRNMGKMEGRMEGRMEGFAQGQIEGEIKGRTLGQIEGELRGQAKMAKRLMKKNSITFEEVMEMLGIPKNEQQELRKYMYS